MWSEDIRNFKHEYAYLSWLNEIAKNKDVSGLYGLEQRRVELHKAIFKNLPYECDIDDPEIYIRSKAIMSNLDKIIGFEPPEHITAGICYKLNRLLTCQEGQYYMQGKIKRLRATYGVIVGEE